MPTIAQSATRTPASAPSPSSPTVGSFARTQPSSSPAITSGIVPDQAGKIGVGSRSRSPGMARMAAPGTDTGPVIQRLSPAPPWFSLPDRAQSYPAAASASAR